MTYYHGGTDWQEGGGEGPMNDHLPECWAKHESDPPAWCICDELRACADRVTALATPETVAQATYWYEQGQRDVFALHTEWTVAGMCKPDCLPCQRLTELINEREAGYSEGQRDAIAAAVQRVEAFEYVSTIGVTLSSVVPKSTVIVAIKGYQEYPPQLPPSVGIPEKKGSLR